MIAPPLVIEREQIDELVDLAAAAIAAAEARLGLRERVRAG